MVSEYMSSLIFETPIKVEEEGDFRCSDVVPSLGSAGLQFDFEMDETEDVEQGALERRYIVICHGSRCED